MYTKNAAQTTMDTKTRISRPRSKDARLCFGVLTGEFGDFTQKPKWQLNRFPCWVTLTLRWASIAEGESKNSQKNEPAC